MPRSGRSPPVYGGSRIAAASTDATTQVLFVGPPGAGKSLLRRQLLRLARLHSGRMASHAGVARRRRQEALTGEPEDRRDVGPRTPGMLCGLCACFSSVSRGAGGDRGSSVEDFGQTNRIAVGNGCSTAERVEVKGKPAARPSNGASLFAELVQRLANPSVSNLYPTLGVELDEFSLALPADKHKATEEALCVPPGESNAVSVGDAMTRTSRAGTRRTPPVAAQADRDTRQQSGSSASENAPGMPTHLRERRWRRSTRGSIVLHHVCMREVGGMMQPLWHNYYGECTKAIFVVDVSDYLSIFKAGLALNECATQLKAMKKDVPLLVVLNKSDAVAPLPDEDLSEGLQMASLSRKLERSHGRGTGHVQETLQVLRASALTGHGLDSIMDWIRAGEERLSTSVSV